MRTDGDEAQRRACQHHLERDEPASRSCAARRRRTAQPGTGPPPKHQQDVERAHSRPLSRSRGPRLRPRWRTPSIPGIRSSATSFRRHAPVAEHQQAKVGGAGRAGVPSPTVAPPMPNRIGMTLSPTISGRPAPGAAQQLVLARDRRLAAVDGHDDEDEHRHHRTGVDQQLDRAPRNFAAMAKKATPRRSGMPAAASSACTAEARVTARTAAAEGQRRGPDRKSPAHGVRSFRVDGAGRSASSTALPATPSSCTRPCPLALPRDQQILLSWIRPARV